MLVDWCGVGLYRDTAPMEPYRFEGGKGEQMQWLQFFKM